MGKSKKKKNVQVPKPKSRKQIRKEKRMRKKMRRNERSVKCEPSEDSPRANILIKKEPLNESDESTFTRQLNRNERSVKCEPSEDSPHANILIRKKPLNEIDDSTFTRQLQLREMKKEIWKLENHIRSEHKRTLKCEPSKDSPHTKILIKKKPLNENDECTFTRQLQQREMEKKMLKKLENQMRNERKRQMLEANHEEDKVIRDLEKKLKLNRRKNKSMPRSFVSEGLDCILYSQRKKYCFSVYF